VLISNSFDIPLPPHEAWPLLMDVPRIAPCLPGAELLEALPDNAYRGKVSVRLGPVALAFNGTAKFEEIDNEAHKARLKASGADAKGRGNASAMVTFSLEPIPAGTRVKVDTDLTLTGAVAQYGRGAGMLQDVAQQLIGQFAKSLKAMLDAQEQVQPAPAPATPASTSIDAPAAEAPAPVMPSPAAASSTPPSYAAKPIGGFSLMARVLWNSILRMFKRN
jgi:carbon monoxide dehydrogenase subunit G